MSELKLTLLGAPRLERDGEALAFNSRKQMALIAYLAMTGRSHTREGLITLLWPELEPSRGRAGLRRELSVIRKALGGQWLTVEGETVGPDPAAAFWLDVAAFRGLVGAWRGHGHREEEVCARCLTALEEAVGLYQGDFMAGLSLRDSAGYDEWQFFQTEGLRGELAGALERLVRGHSVRRGYEEAIPYARRWVALDALHEPAHRALMEAYGRAGQRSAAVRQYEECMRVLEEELGVGPSEETRALYERLRVGGGEGGPLPRHNLPAQVTPFVGRERELEAILARLRDPACRLLTLVGPGGMGKTRLALQAAEVICETQGDHYPHGVHLVRLGLLGSAEGMVPAVAEALGFRFYQGGEPREQLLAYLRGKRLLLVMDSFEHLLEGAGLVADILRSAPEVELLVTSRIRLNLRGEHLLHVEGMAYPEANTWMEGREYSAVELFVQGARRTLAGPDWEPTSEEMKDVVRACALVEGMPLGILLAAAWVEMLAPAEIADEIGRGLDILETDLQDVPERQRSLRAVFDHSWGLLTEREREVFQRLSVFRGGFTGEAAREVAGASLQELRGLLGKSLLERGRNGRYEVHELLRGYAAERLGRDSSLAAGVRDRHSAYFCHWLTGMEEAIKGPKQRAILSAVRRDLDNVRAACMWAADNGRVGRLHQALNTLGLSYWQYSDYRTGAVTFESLANVLKSTGHGKAAGGAGVRPALARTLTWRCALVAVLDPSAGHLLAEECLTLLDSPSLVNEDTRFERAWVADVLGYSWLYQGRARARRYLMESRDLFWELGDKWGVANALMGLARVARNGGELEEAREMAVQSLALCRELGDEQGTSAALLLLGNLAVWQAELEEAENLLRQGLAFRSEMAGMNAPWGQAILGWVEFLLGQLSEAEASLSEAIAFYSERDSPFNVHYWALLLGVVYVHQGRREAACAQMERAVSLAQDLDSERRLDAQAHQEWALGAVALADGAFDRAYRHLQASLDVCHYNGGAWDRIGQLACLGLAARGLGLPSEARSYLLGELRRASTERGFGFAPCLAALSGLALLRADEGEVEQAVELYALVTGHPLVARSRWFEGVLYRPFAPVLEALPREVAAAAVERGRARDLKTTVAELLAELEA